MSLGIIYVHFINAREGINRNRIQRRGKLEQKREEPKKVRKKESSVIGKRNKECNDKKK